MAKDEKSKSPKAADPMTDLLRQMGLCEEEIGAALDLAQNIEKKIEQKVQPEPETLISKFETLSEKELINMVKAQDSQLNYFQNVIAVQFILLIKKYKDKVITLESKIRQKNAQIQELTKQLELMKMPRRR